MATVPVYQQQVRANVQPTVRQEGSAPSSAFGGNVAQAIGGLGEQVYKEVQEQQSKVNLQSVMDADKNWTADTLEAFHNPDTGYFALKGENAVAKPGVDGKPGQLGITARAQQSLEEITKKHMDGLQNQAQKIAFSQHINGKFKSYQQTSMDYEREQSDVVFKTSYAANLENNKKGALAAYTNVNMANSYLRNIMDTVTVIGKKNGLGVDAVKAQTDAIMNETVTGMVGTAINNNELDQANKLMDYYGDKLSADTKATLHAKIRPAMEQNESFSFVNSLMNDPAMKDANGILDTTKMLAAADKMYGIGRTKKVTTPGSANNGDEIIQEGLKQKGKPYDLGADGNDATDCGLFTQQTFAAKGIDLGTRTADGQYRNLEVSGKTFADASQLKKGDLVFLDVPGNRKRWQPSDDPNAVNNDTQAYKGITHVGIYAGDGKVLQAGSSGVDYMSMDTYPVVGFGRAASEGTPGTTETVSAPDLQMLNTVRSMISTKVAESRIQHQQLVQQADDNFSNWLLTNKPKTLAEIENQVSQLSLTGTESLNFIAKGKQFIGLVKMEHNEQSQAAEDKAWEEIYTGQITSPAQLVAKYAGVIPYQRLMSFRTLMATQDAKASRIPSELQAKDNAETIDGVLNEAGIKNIFGAAYMTEKGKILDKLADKVNELKSQGKAVSREDIETMAREQASKAILVQKGMFSRNVKGIVGDVPNAPGWGIDGTSVYYQDPQSGQIIRPTDYRDGKFYTTINGEESEMRIRK